MRTLALAVAAVILAVFAGPLAVTTPSAAAPSSVPTLSVTVNGESSGGKPHFQTVGLAAQNQILVPQVPITLRVTFVNNESVTGGLGNHTFTIADTNGVVKINVWLTPQHNYTLNFTVNSLTPTANVTVNGTSFTPQTDPSTGGVVYYCIPHQILGMQGVIQLAGAVSQAAPEKGILLRAYWIGIIGIAAMLVWIGISYFIIKASSPHFKDSKEHVRRGLP